MNYIKALKALPFPLLVALIVVVLTVGIVLGNFFVTRYCDLNLQEPFTVSGNQHTTVEIFHDGSASYTYTIENKSDKDINVDTALIGTAPDGLTIVIEPEILNLGPLGSGTVTVTFTDSGEFTPIQSDNTPIGFTFTKV